MGVSRACYGDGASTKDGEETAGNDGERLGKEHLASQYDPRGGNSLPASVEAGFSPVGDVISVRDGKASIGTVSREAIFQRPQAIGQRPALGVIDPLFLTFRPDLLGSNCRFQHPSFVSSQQRVIGVSFVMTRFYEDVGFLREHTHKVDYVAFCKGNNILYSVCQ